MVVLTIVLQKLFNMNLNSKVLLITFSILFSSKLCTCQITKFVNQGIVRQQVYFLNADSESSLPFPDSMDNRIWFLDSTVVYEIKMYHNYIDKQGEKNRNFGYWKDYKFSFLDLKTMRCQDYRTFSDTASPICSYKIGEDESFGWRFYSSKKTTDTAGKINELEDTVINSKIYKRIQVLNVDSANGYEYVYYFDCNSPKSIFHLNKSLDDYFPDCQTIRFDLRGNLTLPLTQVMEWKFETQKLFPIELRVLKKWSENMKNTNQEFVDFKVASKECITK